MPSRSAVIHHLGDRGIIDERVDAAELAQSLLPDPAAIGVVSEITVDENGVLTGQFAKFTRLLRSGQVAPVVQGDPVTRHGKAVSDLLTEPPVASGTRATAVCDAFFGAGTISRSQAD